MRAPPRPLALVGLLLAFGCVDETGYECADGTGTLFVDETGYLKPDRVWYSAPAPLTTAQPLTLLGLPGALCTPGGSLEVTPPRGGITTLGPDAAGAFRVDVDEAAAQDTLTFRYAPPDGEERATELVLTDTLGDLAAPGGPGTGPPLLSAVDGGETTVSFSSLSSGEPPFLAFNRTASGVGAYSEEGAPVTLSAAAGDEVCVFSVRTDDRAQSPHLCQPVPAP